VNDPRVRHDLADAFLVLNEPSVRYLLGVLGAIQHAGTNQLQRGGDRQGEVNDGAGRDVRYGDASERDDIAGRKLVGVDRRRRIGESRPPAYDARALRLYNAALKHAENWADELLLDLDELVGEPPL
jgi:hypothetical protein